MTVLFAARMKERERERERETETETETERETVIAKNCRFDISLEFKCFFRLNKFLDKMSHILRRKKKTEKK